MASRRLPAPDIAKAVALIAVIVGHTSYAGLPASIVDFCYSFDMPLFFLVSGYFCKPGISLDWAYVKKNAKALILPYVWTSVFIIVLAGLVTAYVTHYDVVTTMLQWFYAALYGSGGTFEGMPVGIVGIGAIWFLLALFWTKILLTVVDKTPNPFLTVIIFFIIGYSTGTKLWLPWSIQPALCALLFVYVGQKIREKKILEPHALHPLIWVVLLFAWLYCGAFYGHVYMVKNQYDQGLIDIVGGIAGALCVIKGAQLISDRSRILLPLEKLGTITLGVFCMHLVELNVVPWDMVMDYLAVAVPSVPIWVSVLALRIVLIFILSVLLWITPRKLSGIFYPMRAKKLKPTSAP